MKYLITLISILLLTNSCNKSDSSQKYDWQIVDGSGNKLNIVYNKTEKQLIHCTTGCGTSDTPRNLTPCEYYKIIPDEKRICLVAGYTSIDTITQIVAAFYNHCFAIPIFSLNTNPSCQVWLTRRRIVKKKPYELLYSTSKLDTYCGDTIKVLYKGKSVLLRETSDSAFYQEFITN